jgi:hypothetical protein
MLRFNENQKRIVAAIAAGLRMSRAPSRGEKACGYLRSQSRQPDPPSIELLKAIPN